MIICIYLSANLGYVFLGKMLTKPFKPYKTGEVLLFCITLQNLIKIGALF